MRVGQIEQWSAQVKHPGGRWVAGRLIPESGVKTLVLGLKSFEPPDFVEDVVNQML
jgi:hypothetical protein